MTDAEAPYTESPEAMALETLSEAELVNLLAKEIGMDDRPGGEP
jgi:hypothetical protein